MISVTGINENLHVIRMAVTCIVTKEASDRENALHKSNSKPGKREPTQSSVLHLRLQNYSMFFEHNNIAYFIDNEEQWKISIDDFRSIQIDTMDKLNPAFTNYASYDRRQCREYYAHPVNQNGWDYFLNDGELLGNSIFDQHLPKNLHVLYLTTNSAKRHVIAQRAMCVNRVSLGRNALEALLVEQAAIMAAIQKAKGEAVNAARNQIEKGLYG